MLQLDFKSKVSLYSFSFQVYVYFYFKFPTLLSKSLTNLSFRQIPKQYFDPEYITRLRQFGFKGRRNGHLGRDTYFYTKVI